MIELFLFFIIQFQSNRIGRGMCSRWIRLTDLLMNNDLNKQKQISIQFY